MAHFRGTVQGNRGMASRLAGKNGTLTTNAATWTAGIRVIVYHDAENKQDIFEIWETDGKHGNAVNRIKVLTKPTI